MAAIVGALTDRGQHRRRGRPSGAGIVSYRVIFITVPPPYGLPFRIDRPVGNNALSYERRGEAPSLWVPSLVIGTIDDVTPGDRVVFEDFDEHGVLQSCTGLLHLVRTTLRGVPAVIVDNHNHAFYFWCEALAEGVIERGATLIHVDQHRDTRIPDQPYQGTTLDDAFEYTNFHLNVGNYVVPARTRGLIGDIQFVTSSEALTDLSLAPRTNKILNIDLDFFALEMSYIDFGTARRFIEAHLPSTSLVTIATSPFFIEQARAIEVLGQLDAVIFDRRS